MAVLTLHWCGRLWLWAGNEQSGVGGGKWMQDLDRASTPLCLVIKE